MVLSKQQERFKIYRDMNQVCNLQRKYNLWTLSRKWPFETTCAHGNPVQCHMFGVCNKRNQSHDVRRKRWSARPAVFLENTKTWCVPCGFFFLCVCFLSHVIPNTCCIICGLQHAGQVSGFQCSAAPPSKCKMRQRLNQTSVQRHGVGMPKHFKCEYQNTRNLIRM